MAYEFVRDYTKAERDATITLRSALNSKIDTSTWDQLSLDRMKKLVLDLIHQQIDEPQITAEQRETLLSIDATNQTKHRNITNSANVDTYPSFFPDGVSLAYQRDSDIYVMDKDGSNNRLLVANGSMPHVSNTGFYVAFIRSGQVFLYNMETATESQVTTGGSAKSHPRVYGNRIVYTIVVTSLNQVHIMNLDGTAQTNIGNAAQDMSPAGWFPDGSKLVYAAGASGANKQIYTMLPDGTAKTQLTSTVSSEFNPVVAPNAAKIAFQSTRNGATTEIYFMDVDGTDQTRLTNNAVEDSFPTYSSDGMYLTISRSNDIFYLPSEGVPPYAEYRHEYLMSNNNEYHAAWAYDHATGYMAYVDESPKLRDEVEFGRMAWTYREDDPIIIQRSLLRHGYRTKLEGEVDPPLIVGRRAPTPVI